MIALRCKKGLGSRPHPLLNLNPAYSRHYFEYYTIRPQAIFARRFAVGIDLFLAHIPKNKIRPIIHSLVNLTGPMVRTMVRRLIWPYPALYSLANRVYRPEKIAPSRAVVIIDGFPRSGNWFSYAAFSQSQSGPVMVCHHHHSPSVILEGLRLGIPVILLIRSPRTALLSAIVARPDRSMWELLNFYFDYYSLLEHLRSSVVVATFDQVTQNFGKVIQRLNQRYSTSFAEFHHTHMNVEACFSWLAQAQRSTNPELPIQILAHPAADRGPLRLQAESSLNQMLKDNVSFASRMAAAELLFQKFAETAIEQETKV